MQDKTVGYTLLALAMATVGTTVIASKLIAGSIPPFTATALRFALALPVLVLIAMACSSSLPRLSVRMWGLLALQAGAGSVGYTVLLISGLTFLSAADAGVIIGTLPAVSALFAVLVLGERLSTRVMLSVACATAGVLVVAWQGSGPDSLIGILLVLGAVICESAFILMQKRMGTPLAPLMQATTMTGFGLVLTLPFALAEGIYPTLPLTALAAVAWYALVPTVGGFMLWYAGAARVPGAEAAIFTAVAPVTAVVLSAAVLGEALGTARVAGLSAVALAILILSFPAQRRDLP
jgi:drug/metabolite transporter (DMT)-like permease